LHGKRLPCLYYRLDGRGITFKGVRVRIVAILMMVAAASVLGQSVLLLSEICVRPSAGEFMEVYNPGSTSVPLDDYYLTDLYGDVTKVDEFYPYIVCGAISSQLNTDFLVSFPPGATVAPGEAVTVAMDGSGFLGEYGFAPDFDLAGSGTGTSMEIPANGFVGSNAGLTNGAETVTLFYWDGISDLVLDSDYAQWGTDQTRRVFKNGISLDGPDAGSTPSGYLDETPPGEQESVSPSAHDNGQSYQRIDFNEGYEILSGGNGIDGHDETSENLSVTWTTDTVGPGGVQTPLSRSTWAEIKAVF
jgi:hypothetical protein